jgi:hypothetical protein
MQKRKIAALKMIFFINIGFILDDYLEILSLNSLGLAITKLLLFPQ